ncbi:MAG: branched-chain amino acid ABC transporter permease, partial [Candidatus Odyssella sp.]|nr:branched-chain amino acid ABC transporter permease [Candidatus Odyssella sp.]
MNDYVISVLANIGMFSFLALSAYLLLITGEISFGQQAFFAIGAYASGIATALWGLPFALALVIGAAAGGAAAGLVGLLTLRTRGLYFAMATLAFAELVRLGLQQWVYVRQVEGEPVGPNGVDGFRGIRYVFENNIAPGEFLSIIAGLLAAVLLGFALVERGRLGSLLRLVGADPLLAETQGVNVKAVKVAAAAAAGAVAALGGCLFAHLNTYVEPRNFDIMLGVHSLAYGLIGGLGTAAGPLLGVLIDVGLLESVRVFQGYRMIVFGGLVALLLVFMPRGILDETRLRWLGARLR